MGSSIRMAPDTVLYHPVVVSDSSICCKSDNANTNLVLRELIAAKVVGSQKGETARGICGMLRFQLWRDSAALFADSLNDVTYNNMNEAKPGRLAEVV